MSFWDVAIVAATKAVTAPMTAIVSAPVGRQREHRRHAHEQVDPGGHHGRGVDEGRHRRRALHRVGQPVEERDLGGLAGRGEQQRRAPTSVATVGDSVPAPRGRSPR